MAEDFKAAGYPETYLEDLEREALGYERRILELKDLPGAEVALGEAKSGLDAVKAELKRLGGSGQKSAAKRPRASAKKETRKKK